MIKTTKYGTNQWPWPDNKKQDVEKHIKLLTRFNNENGAGARYAIKIEGAWYEVSVVKTPKPLKRKRVTTNGETEYFTHFPSFDSVSIHGAKYTPPELGTNNFYVCRKEQLNTKRLRELGLR